MAAKSRGYEPLREDSLERCAITTEIPELPHHRRRTFTLGAKPMTFIVSILIFSLATNIFLGSKIRLLSCDGECSSFYGMLGHLNHCTIEIFMLERVLIFPLLSAGLKRDIPIEIYPTTKYTGDNITEVRALWEELSGDTGVVALSAVFVEEKRLKQAMRFPWDEEKGVYLLQGFHNLHCLVCIPSSMLSHPIVYPSHSLLRLAMLTMRPAHSVSIHHVYGNWPTKPYCLFSCFALFGSTATRCYL
jgi:hypothetical protein